MTAISPIGINAYCCRGGRDAQACRKFDGMRSCQRDRPGRQLFGDGPKHVAPRILKARLSNTKLPSCVRHFSIQLSRHSKRHNSTGAPICGTIPKRNPLAPGKTGEWHATGSARARRRARSPSLHLSGNRIHTYHSHDGRELFRARHRYTTAACCDCRAVFRWRDRGTKAAGG